VESLTRKITELKSTKRDVWLGLTDNNSSNMFWYNLRDETSFWMTPEDQEQYRVRRSQSVDERAGRLMKPTASASPRKKLAAQRAVGEASFVSFGAEP
jgi:hypothetical protein